MGRYTFLNIDEKDDDFDDNDDDDDDIHTDYSYCRNTGSHHQAEKTCSSNNDKYYDDYNDNLDTDILYPQQQQHHHQRQQQNSSQHFTDANSSALSIIRNCFNNSHHRDNNEYQHQQQTSSSSSSSSLFTTTSNTQQQSYYQNPIHQHILQPIIQSQSQSQQQNQQQNQQQHQQQNCQSMTNNNNFITGFRMILQNDPITGQHEIIGTYTYDNTTGNKEVSYLHSQDEQQQEPFINTSSSRKRKNLRFYLSIVTTIVLSIYIHYRNWSLEQANVNRMHSTNSDTTTNILSSLWDEYTQQQRNYSISNFFSSTVVFVCTKIPIHIVQSVTATMYDTFQHNHLESNFSSWSKSFVSTILNLLQLEQNYKQQIQFCSLQVPTHNNIEQIIKNYVIGQDIAIQVLVESIINWWWKVNNTYTNTTNNNTPLIVLATGDPHTGKHSLIYYLVRYVLFNHCFSHDTETTSQQQQQQQQQKQQEQYILHLQGYEWDTTTNDDSNCNNDDDSTAKTDNSTDDDNDSSSSTNVCWTIDKLQTKLYHTIYDFITTTRNTLGGGVIVISEIERMHPQVLYWLLQQLTTKNDVVIDTTTTTTTTSTIRLILRQVCYRTIFYLTSNEIGIRTITKSIVQSSSSSSVAAAGTITSTNLPSILSDIEYTFHRYFVNTIEIQQQQQSQLLQHDIQTVLNHLDIIILPFNPITQSILVQLFYKRIHDLSIQYHHVYNWSKLQITNNAINAFLHPDRIFFISIGSTSNTGNSGTGTGTVESSSLPVLVALDGATVLSDIDSISTTDKNGPTSIGMKHMYGRSSSTSAQSVIMKKIRSNLFRCKESILSMTSPPIDDSDVTESIEEDATNYYINDLQSRIHTNDDSIESDNDDVSVVSSSLTNVNQQTNQVIIIIDYDAIQHEGVIRSCPAAAITKTPARTPTTSTDRIAAHDDDDDNDDNNVSGEIMAHNKQPHHYDNVNHSLCTIVWRFDL